MQWHREIWTYLLVTVVAALIWFWAAGETRDRKTFNHGVVQFKVADTNNWLVRPQEVVPTVVAYGSNLSLQKMESELRRRLTISVSATAGLQDIDLMAQLRNNDRVRATGATILSVEPATVKIDLDPVEEIAVRVKPALPGITPEGDMTIEPAEVTLSMPSQLRQRLPQRLQVEAFVDRSELDRLEPGRPHTLDVKLRLPEGLPNTSDITITPARAKLTFVIRSRTREVSLDTVRVHVAGPPEDRDLYDIEVDPKQLRNIVISTDADLATKIESGEAPVVAVIHLSSREKEARIESKRISGFVALVPEPGGGTRMVEVKGLMTGGGELPPVSLTISLRPIS